MEASNFDWSREQTIDGEIYKSDLLQRSNYAEYLTRLLEYKGFDENRVPKERNYVLNLNSEWGSGKTYFIKRWAKSLENSFPVVYVDAWEKDYSDDPLLTVIAAIIKQLRIQIGEDEDSKLVKAPASALKLLKAAAPGMARGFAKRYLGFDAVEVIDNLYKFEEETSEEQVESSNSKHEDTDLSFSASAAVKHLIEEHDGKSESIKELKKEVKNWVLKVKDKNNLSLPAFIFIDELDRCRPSYAVEMLEVIKHIFDIEGVVFVVSTDTEQLQHAIKAIYGLNFNAQVYLNRFFDSKFSLPANNIENLLYNHDDLNLLSYSNLEERGIIVSPINKELHTNIKNLSILFNSFGVNARLCKQILSRMLATILNEKESIAFDIIKLGFYHCMKEVYPEAYDSLKKGSNIRFRGEMKSIQYYLSTYINYSKEPITSNINPTAFFQEIGCHEVIYNLPNAPIGEYKIELKEYINNLILDDSQTSMNVLAADFKYTIKNLNTVNKDKSLEELAIIFYKLIPYIPNKTFYQKEDYIKMVELSASLDVS